MTHISQSKDQDHPRDVYVQLILHGKIERGNSSPITKERLINSGSGWQTCETLIKCSENNLGFHGINEGTACDQTGGWATIETAMEEGTKE
jgi:hypothetical protein